MDVFALNAPRRSFPEIILTYGIGQSMKPSQPAGGEAFCEINS
jgi:hypothetical protein